MINNQDKVIIFTRFKRMSIILQRELQKWNPVLINGDTSTEERGKNINKFKTDPSCRIMIGTNAIREGLNLTEANIIVMYDQDFTSASHDQRIGRAWRLGQKKQVRVYHLLSEGTVDHKFVRLVNRKKKASDILLGELIKD